MNPEPNHRSPRPFHWLSLLISMIFFMAVFGSFAWLVQAEGSRNLYPNNLSGFFRANTEWRTSFYGSNFIRRRTLLQVYAEKDEVILVGSSAVSVTNGDIRIYDPGTVSGDIGKEILPGSPNFSCQDQRLNQTGNLTQGRIISRTQELAGPDTITDATTAARGNDIPEGYVPCFYPASTSGIYYVVFLGPEGDASNAEIAPTGELDLTSPNNFNAQQSTSVAAWDVTVRSDLTSTSDITGRLFANYLALFTGANPRPVSSTLYILTTDGYIYRTDLRGVDPNGFVIYANNVGFLNTDDSPLFHDVVANANQLDTLQGEVKLAPPTHLIFFERPSSEAIVANGITLTPVAPEISSIEFNGNLGDNDSTVSGGGTFIYTSNVTGTYEIIISRDGVDFDPTNPVNRVLRGIRPPGPQSVTWDGLDNAGDPFPVGLDYPVRVTVRAGEYHFPLLDVENSRDGGPQYTLLNPPGGKCPSFNGGPRNCNIAFYDDRGYTTASDIDVGVPGAILPGNAPPPVDHSDPLGGFDTITDQHRFGDGTNAGFGDKKGLDLWTYFPGQPRDTTLNIYAFNLLLTKTDGGVTVSPGEVVNYSLTFTNTGPISATGVVITEMVPDNTTFNEAASLPTQWSCSDGSPPGILCTTAIGLLPGGATGSVNFAVTVDDVAQQPCQAGQLVNTAIIGDDGTHGSEPPDDNTDTDPTPCESPPPTPTRTPTPHNDDNDSLPTPTPTPTPSPSTVTVQLTPTLPILFLPETGLKGTLGVSKVVVGSVLGLVTLLTISLAIPYVHRRLKRKNIRR